MNSVSGSDWIHFTTRIAIYIRDGFSCVACGTTEALSLDHVKPRHLKGSNHYTNLVTMCVYCNSSRGNRPFIKWRPDLVSIVYKLKRRKLDRKKAREMAEYLRPGRLAKNRDRVRRWRLKSSDVQDLPF